MGILLNLMPFWARWVILAAFLASIAAFSAFKMHQYDTKHAKIAYDALQGRFYGFVSQVTAKGEAARRQALWQAQTDEMRKETADADLKAARASTDSANAGWMRLAKARSDGGYLPPSSTASVNPQRATIDRAKFERAMEFIDGEGARIAARGDGERVGLDSAKRWAVTERPAVK